jgi:hypothetical protein
MFYDGLSSGSSKYSSKTMAKIKKKIPQKGLKIRFFFSFLLQKLQFLPIVESFVLETKVPYEKR